MADDQRDTRVLGVLFLLAFGTSIAALLLGIYAAVWGFRRDAPTLSPQAGRSPTRAR